MHKVSIWFRWIRKVVAGGAYLLVHDAKTRAACVVMRQLQLQLGCASALQTPADVQDMPTS